VIAVNDIGYRLRVTVTATNSPDSSSASSYPSAEVKPFSPVWTITELGLPAGATGAAALALNDVGQVVGDATLPGGLATSFLWQNGWMRALGTLGGATSKPVDVNNAGQVVGDSGSSSYPYRRAFIWDAVLGMRDLGSIPGATHHYAKSVNEAGIVVGTGQISTDRVDGWTWEDGVMTQLPGPQQGSWFTARAINEPGHVTGTVSAGGAATAQVRVADPVDFYALDAPSGTSSHTPQAISDSGHLAGNGVMQNGQWHAVRWGAQGLEDLGVLAGGNFSWAAADITELDEVVGRSYTTTGGGDHAILHRCGRLFDLNSFLPPGSGWQTLTFANGINESSQITGYGVKTDGTTRSYLLTPPPTVCLEKEAELDVVPAGSLDAYTITVTNYATVDVTLDEIVDTLPSGFTYVEDSSSGLTDAEPEISGDTLTWTGPFVVPARAQQTLEFMVTAAGTPGEYFNDVTATSQQVAVIPAVDTAKITVVAAQPGDDLDPFDDDEVGRYAPYQPRFPSPPSRRLARAEDDVPLYCETVTSEKVDGRYRFCNQDGNWYIYENCTNISIEDPETHETKQYAAGPGYIAEFRDKTGRWLIKGPDPVDGAGGSVQSPSTWGGLASFGWHAARGTPGKLNTRPDQSAYTQASANEGAYVDINGNLCVDTPGGTGAGVHRSADIAYQSGGRYLDIEVFFRDKWDTSHDLARVYYRWYFGDDVVRVGIVVTFYGNRYGGAPLVSEPKFHARIEGTETLPSAEIAFKRMTLLRDDGDDIRSTQKGQRLEDAVIGQQGIGHSYERRRAGVRWDYGNPEDPDSPPPCTSTTPCFVAVMRALLSSTIDTTPPPYAGSWPWMNGRLGLGRLVNVMRNTPLALVSGVGHDGPGRPAKRARAFVRDTWGDESLTRCKAKKTIGQPDNDLWKWKDSKGADVSRPGTYRWEHLARKEDGNESNPYIFAVTQFHAWEGGRGKTDCEPLFRALPASGQESYGTFGAFYLWEEGEGIVLN
jgi:uncharacterized repeat protein (TIGR01451 family)